MVWCDLIDWIYPPNGSSEINPRISIQSESFGDKLQSTLKHIKNGTRILLPNTKIMMKEPIFVSNDV